MKLTKAHRLRLPFAKLYLHEAQQKLYTTFNQAALWDEVKDRLNMPEHSLSGGQQQRLCLASTLTLEPEILVLDEPTAS